MFAGSTPAYAAGDVAAGELNGDAKADLIVTSETTVYVLLGNGHGGFTAGDTYAVARAPQSPELGDFDGDGKPDLAVAGAGKTGSRHGATQLSVLRNVSP